MKHLKSIYPRAASWDELSKKHKFARNEIDSMFRKHLIVQVNRTKHNVSAAFLLKNSNRVKDSKLFQELQVSDKKVFRKIPILISKKKPKKTKAHVAKEDFPDTFIQTI